MKILVLFCIILVLNLSDGCHKNIVHVEKGIVQTPSPYPNDQFCNTHIQVKKGEHVHFRMEKVEFGGEENHDFVMLFNGPDCLSERLGIYTKFSPWPMISTNNHMTILTVSDMSQAGAGFKGHFKAKRRPSEEHMRHSALYFSPNAGEMMLNCGSELPNTNHSFVVPMSSRLPQVCIWRIIGEHHQRINVTITDAQSLSGSNWLRVLDGGSCDKKSLLYLHNVVDDSNFTAASTQNEVVIFMVRQKGYSSNMPLKISYTLSAIPTHPLTPLSELKYYYGSDYMRAEVSAGLKLHQARAMVFALILVSLRALYL